MIPPPTPTHLEPAKPSTWPAPWRQLRDDIATGKGAEALKVKPLPWPAEWATDIPDGRVSLLAAGRIVRAWMERYVETCAERAKREAARDIQEAAPRPEPLSDERRQELFAELEASWRGEARPARERRRVRWTSYAARAVPKGDR